MATLIVPPVEKGETKIFATLGEQVAEWLEDWAVWGPGSKYGQPVTVDDEFYAWLLRAYQIFPRNHPRAGRRRFDLCSKEMAKGTGKTEHAIIVGQAEFHPTAPVRCVDWERRGRAWVPVGAQVPYPRLIFVASTEDQVDRTGFGRFRQALQKCPLAADYHITLDRIVLLGEAGAPAGESYPLAVAPAAADGDLPTWQHVDEPHRWDTRRHRDMFETVRENTLKDPTADAWTMTTSTAGATGADSVEEQLLHSAEAIARGEMTEADSSFFFMRRFCPDDPDGEWPLETFEDVEAAVREARGPAASWSGDIPRIVAKYFDPKTDRPYWRRVWLNHWTKGSGAAFNAELFRQRFVDEEIPAGAFVTLGFDGARRRDSTGLIATEIASGRQAVLAVWQRPLELADDDEWEVPPDEVDAAVSAAFERFDVWRLYADPPYWDDWVRVWEGRWPDRVVAWWTNRDKPMAHALRSYAAAIIGGDLTVAPYETFGHTDGRGLYAIHIGNAYKKVLPIRDDQDVELWVIRKDRHDSPDKIDLDMAGCLAWEARMDAIAADAKPTPKAKSRRVRAW